MITVSHDFICPMGEHEKAMAVTKEYKETTDARSGHDAAGSFDARNRFNLRRAVFEVMAVNDRRADALDFFDHAGTPVHRQTKFDGFANSVVPMPVGFAMG